MTGCLKLWYNFFKEKLVITINYLQDFTPSTCWLHYTEILPRVGCCYGSRQKLKHTGPWQSLSLVSAGPKSSCNKKIVQVILYNLQIFTDKLKQKPIAVFIDFECKELCKNSDKFYLMWSSHFQHYCHISWLKLLNDVHLKPDFAFCFYHYMYF